MRNNSFFSYEFIADINKQLIEIKRNSREAETINKVQQLMDYVEECYGKVDTDRKTLEKNIEKSMKRARNKNSDLEATLYMIHGDLLNSRISVERARELYEQYLNMELFDENKF